MQKVVKTSTATTVVTGYRIASDILDAAIATNDPTAPVLSVIINVRTASIMDYGHRVVASILPPLACDFNDLFLSVVIVRIYISCEVSYGGARRLRR